VLDFIIQGILSFKKEERGYCWRDGARAEDCKEERQAGHWWKEGGTEVADVVGCGPAVRSTCDR
jgi:hypothetical protein